MDYEALLNNFDELNEQINKAKEEMRGKSKGLIEAAVKRFLDSCPEVTGVHWVQYTPYFNDGESCEFDVNEICFHILDEYEELDSFYESTTIYKQDDLDKAIADLKTAEEYTNNPVQWREYHTRKYVEKYGREPYYGHDIKPYPSDPVKAQKRIDEIKEVMKKFPEDVSNKIEINFAMFKAAMCKISDDIMESVYGNHVSVIINRSGTTVDEFQHD